MNSDVMFDYSGSPRLFSFSPTAVDNGFDVTGVRQRRWFKKASICENVTATCFRAAHIISLQHASRPCLYLSNPAGSERQW
jgi:hypothetical protein